MADKIKTTSSKTGGTTGRRRLLIAVLLLLPVLAAAGAVIGCRALKALWFTDNDRLALRGIRISSRGYWNNREETLMKRLDLHPGMRLFALDPMALRKKLEAIPCVESARVYRVLPDTLFMEINERIPRAELGSQGSPLVVDEEGVVIPRSESLAENGKLELPVVTGVKIRSMPVGKADERLKPALDLIMLTLRRYPMFRIKVISMSRPDSMVCYFLYRGGRQYYRAVLPVKSKGMAFLLSALESALIEVRRTGDARHNFNLSYSGQVVVN